MKPTRAFQQTLLRQMLLGLRLSVASSKTTMTLQERKAAVKLSADAAMACARGSRRWTRGLVARLGKDDKNKSLLQFILGKQYERLTKPPSSSPSWKIPRSKRIVRRSLAMCSTMRKRKQAKRSSGGVLARNLVKKRTQVLRRLVPGGESLDGFSLLDETLDYVIALRAQVDLMQNLLSNLEASKLRAKNGCAILPERKASFVGK